MNRDAEASVSIVWVSAPAEVGQTLAAQIVEARLAACVTLLPGATSVYRWKGAVETASETLLMIKTAADRIEALEAFIVAHHPYDVPEVLHGRALGHAPYLAWVEASTRPL